ncbi:MAG: peptidoglycan DD-metalloendopeptidase family protein [Fibrobacterota bacterium]
MKKFSFLIVPKLGGPIREYAFTPRTLLLLLLLLVFGGVSVYLTVRDIHPFLVERNELLNLRAENKNLENQLIEMTKRIILLKKKIRSIAQKETEIRKLANLDDDGRTAPVPPEVRDAAKQKIEKINADLRSLTTLSRYYDSLVTRISSQTGIIEHVPTIRPVCDSAYISARFGMKEDPFSAKIKPHQGVDFAFHTGTPVLAAAAGTVAVTGKEKGFGYVIRISHGYGYETMYAHLDQIVISMGRTVSKGQVIGTLGNTGRSIGPHLHYEVLKDGKQVDPETYF